MITRSKSKLLTQAREQKPKMPPLTSCYECHMRWYSCDKGTPCAKCVKHGRVCTYAKTMVDGTEVSCGDSCRSKRCGVLIRNQKYLTPANRTRNGKLLVPDAPAAVSQVVLPPVVATRATAQAAPLAPAPQAAAPRSTPRARAYMAASQAEIDPDLIASSPSLQNQEQNQEQIQESEPRGKKKPIVLTGCRACHLRSIKCNGGRPCLPCSHSNLPCTYDKTMVNGKPVSLDTVKGEQAVLTECRCISEMMATQETVSSSSRTTTRACPPPHCIPGAQLLVLVQLTSMCRLTRSLLVIPIMMRRKRLSRTSERKKTRGVASFDDHRSMDADKFEDCWGNKQQ